MKNSFPQCNFCTDVPNKAEWMIIYGGNATNDYTFACTQHIGTMIESIQKGRFGKVSAFYCEHWTTNGSYDEHWNNEWNEHHKKITL